MTGTLEELRRREVAVEAFKPLVREMLARGELMPVEEIAAHISEAIEQDPALVALGANSIDVLDSLVLGAETLRTTMLGVRREHERREREAAS